MTNTKTHIERIAEGNGVSEARYKEVSDNHPETAISAHGTARSTVQGAPLGSEELREIEEYWHNCESSTLITGDLSRKAGLKPIRC
jgi:hypothetical protein